MAVILYSPVFGGVHMIAKLPLASLIAEPMLIMLLSGPVAVSTTWTPVAVVGRGPFA